MLDTILEAFITTLIMILMLSGSGFVLWWGVETSKRYCDNSNCCKKIKKKLKI